MKTLAFLRPVVIERRNSTNAMRRGNDIELKAGEPYDFTDEGAAFFMGTYPNDVLNLSPSPCAIAVRAALAAMRTCT